MKKRHLILCMLLAIASLGSTQPVPLLLQKFDKTRCFDHKLVYDVGSPPFSHRINYSTVENPGPHKFVVWKVDGENYQRVDEGMAKMSVLIDFKSDGNGKYVLLIRDSRNPVLVEMNLNAGKLEAVTYSHCATHSVSSR
ncbi:MAG: hypothetical protein AAF731_07670 [Bacteroidota bacterium]